MFPLLEVCVTARMIKCYNIECKLNCWCFYYRVFFFCFSRVILVLWSQTSFVSVFKINRIDYFIKSKWILFVACFEMKLNWGSQKKIPHIRIELTYILSIVILLAISTQSPNHEHFYNWCNQTALSYFQCFTACTDPIGMDDVSRYAIKCTTMPHHL